MRQTIFFPDSRDATPRESVPVPEHVVVSAALNEGWLTADRRPDPRFSAAIVFLEQTGVPLVIWSSDTRAEIETVRQQLGLRGLFISENGAALFVPSGYFTFPLDSVRRVPGYDVFEFGAERDEILATLRRVAGDMGIDLVTLADMTIEEVAAGFGIGLLAARLAKLREYSELFTVADDRTASRGRLFRGLRAAGLTCVHARYDQVSGVSDRAAALQVAHRLMRRGRHPVLRIGIGSGLEDLPVLAQADLRIVIAQRDEAVTAHLLAQMPNAQLVEGTGLEGWLEALSSITTIVRRRH